MMIKTIERYPIASLALFIIVMFGFTAGAIPVSIMEARNFITAREMLTENNWFLTTMNGAPRYEKPPLPSWITALFGFLFGFKNVLALRLPALLMIAVIGIATYLLSVKILRLKSHALINGFLAMTSLYVMGISIESPNDIYTYGFMMVAIYHLYQLLSLIDNKKRNLIYFIVFVAASVLSKGPVSLYVLLLSFLLAYGFSFKFIKMLKLKYLKILFYLFVGIGIGASWYLYVGYNDPVSFNEIIKKETTNWSEYETQPFYYYWHFYIQAGIWTLFAFISLLYPYLKTKVLNKTAYKFSFLWTVFAIILLSFIPEKKPRYVMPALIPLAINMGFYINYLISVFRNLKSLQHTIATYIQFGLISVIGILFPLSYFIFESHLSGKYIVLFILASIIMASIGLLILKSLKRKNVKHAFYLTLGFILCVGLFIVPFAKKLTKVDTRAIENFETQDLPMYSLNKITPEIVYYFGKKVPSIGYSNNHSIPKEASFYLLTISQSIENEMSKTYSINRVETIDLNTSNGPIKNNNDRLVNYIYKLDKK